MTRSDPVGFSIYCEDRQISIVTDVGCITEAIFDEIVGADLLLLEANHEKEILLMSRYPYHLKHRILGDKDICPTSLRESACAG